MAHNIVYGGSFSPVTWAHEEVIGLLLGLIYVDNVFVVPVGDFYEKKGLIPVKHRLNILKHLSHNDRVIISDIEAKANRQLKTYETLTKLQILYPDDNFSFVIGADNLEYINTWAQAELLLKNFKIFVLEREGYDVLDIIERCQLLRNYKNNITSIKTDIGVGISSTGVRELISKNASDEQILEFIDEETLNYIKENNLYKE